MYALTARETIKLEEEAAKQGISTCLLMERAGKAVFKSALEILPKKRAKVVVIAGKGNNGGDGFVAFRLFLEKGISAKLFMLASPGELKGEAAYAFKTLKNLNNRLTVLSPTNIGALDKALKDANLVVDAIFGFGLKGEVKGFTAEVISRINQAGCLKLSVDVPSGLEADTGDVKGFCVRATRTVTFTSPKVGLLIYPGREFAGEVKVANIGIPKKLVEGIGRIKIIDREELKTVLPKHPPDAHKKSCGRVLVIAGSRGMTGAAHLTALSALKSGAGLVALGVSESLNSIFEQKLTEILTYPLPETSAQTISLKAYGKIVELVANFDVLALGPGLSTNKSTVSLVRKLIKNVKLPLVLDADGLNACVGKTELLKARKAPLIITPHPGELARLLNTTPEKIQSDRINAALEATRGWEVTVVLKGANSIIADSRSVAINPTGNQGMASAGTGDVLTGFISSFLAQGLAPYDAARLGTYLHGLSGDIAATELTPHCLIAGDLLSYLPQAMKQLMC